MCINYAKSNLDSCNKALNHLHMLHYGDKAFQSLITIEKEIRYSVEFDILK